MSRRGFCQVHDPVAAPKTQRRVRRGQVHLNVPVSVHIIGGAAGHRDDVLAVGFELTDQFGSDIVTTAQEPYARRLILARLDPREFITSEIDNTPVAKAAKMGPARLPNTGNSRPDRACVRQVKLAALTRMAVALV